MRERRNLLYLVVFGAALLIGTQLSATTVLQMDLGELTQRADRIFRGTVIDIIPGTADAAGGTVPMTTYRLQVEESFKGDVDQVKGDQAMIEIRMVGSVKGSAVEGDYVRFDLFKDVPRLRMGSDYLLFTSRPGPSGLSTTIGLGQGAFSVFTIEKQDFVVNQFNNGGLGLDQTGPIAYSDIAAKILTLLGQGGE